MAEKAQELYDWYRQNRPDVKVLRLKPDAIAYLIERPDLAAEVGFHVNSGELWFRDFEVKPT